MRHHLTPVRMAIINESTNNCWRGCAERGTLLHCWWEGRLVQPLCKTVWIYLRKIKNGTALWLSDSSSGYILKETRNTNAKEYMHPYVHCSVIYNSQDLETAEVTINGWVGEKAVIHIYNGILLSHKKWNLSNCTSMHVSRGYYAKWNRAGREGQRGYNFSYVRDLKININEHTKQKLARRWRE